MQETTKLIINTNNMGYKTGALRDKELWKVTLDRSNQSYEEVGNDLVIDDGLTIEFDDNMKFIQIRT